MIDMSVYEYEDEYSMNMSMNTSIYEYEFEHCAHSVLYIYDTFASATK